MAGVSLFINANWLVICFAFNSNPTSDMGIYPTRIATTIAITKGPISTDVQTMFVNFSFIMIDV